MWFLLILRYLEILIWIYLSLTVFYTLLLSLFALWFYREPILPETHNYLPIAIIVPAYKEDSIIEHSILEHLTLNYPKDKFRVFLAADSFMPETIIRLKDLPITILEMKFELSTVTKSVKNAVFDLKHENFPITLICDADNVLEKDFLLKINRLFQTGIEAVQAKRYTKNLNTSMAVLDSISEIINNHLFKKGSYALGLSAALTGSGMAFNTQILQDCLKNNHSIGGYDRDLQLALSERKIRIHYLESAICYDEKVSNLNSFGNQRRRWLSAQFIDLKEHFFKSFKILFTKGGINYFQLGFINNFFLPRVLNLGLLFIISFISAILSFLIHGFFLSPFFWLIIFISYVISLGLAVPRLFFNEKLLTALKTLPSTFLVMFGLLFKLKGANQNFIHTEHHVMEVDQSLLDEK